MPRSSLQRALYLNAAILAVIAGALIFRGHTPSLDQRAIAEQPAIGGGAGVFVVPAQFSTTTWGCYLIDVDAQTLVAYIYTPGDRMLRLAAARSYRFDRRLEALNTQPLPQEVRQLIEKQAGARQDADLAPEPRVP